MLVKVNTCYQHPVFMLKRLRYSAQWKALGVGLACCFKGNYEIYKRHMATNRLGQIPSPEHDFGESQLIRFYRGLQRDASGRMISEIWKMNEDELEINHDYIQWLFPLAQKSQFNPNAPVLSQRDILLFSSDKDLQARVGRSFAMMLSFYGFAKQPVDGHFEIVPSAHHTSRRGQWLVLHNHNYLRISRILNFLMLIHLNAEARAFFDALQKLNRVYHEKIGSAFSHWRAAIA